ncbi:IgA peptidase M64-domain-containing protein [Amylostereum chailletii]|nr:IgA peptidase M64-domain-containing protein [Amylostereum chailletii]
MSTAADEEAKIPNDAPTVPPLELVPIAPSRPGPSDNRVDITFFADGYLAEERAKFIQDVVGLVGEISGNQTFHTVAPLLNFWAAFTPSKESGVGVGGVPKDTPFGLYRDGTELRALYYAKPEVARAACDSLESRCDYPVLIGNDPLYGGGGLRRERRTITPSKMNGALVLRHELGHSVIEVGEEYDGGFAYFGPNAGHDASVPMPWAHWLTPHTLPADGLPRVERSVMPMQAYPWTLLNTSTPWKTKFNSSGSYARHLVRFSLSGLPTTTDLTVLLDGDDLGWTAKEGLGVDRWHYDVHRDAPLGAGEHEVTFVLNAPAREGGAQLCSVEILEFGDEDEFSAAPGVYGVYPTVRPDPANTTSYRPTNEDCLMRIVDQPNFCRACVEGLWHALLSRVDLIESLGVECVPAPPDDRDDGAHADGAMGREGRWTRALNASLLPLAGLRAVGEARGGQEAYAIAWTRDGNAVEAFANATYVVLEEGQDRGRFEVAVEFLTEEVRVDPEGLLKSTRFVDITSGC